MCVLCSCGTSNLSSSTGDAPVSTSSEKKSPESTSSETANEDESNEKESSGDLESSSDAEERIAFVLDVSTLSDTSIGPINTEHLELRFGDLLSVNYGGNGVFVVKAKISPSYSNKATINQNYFSVCDLIKQHGFDACEEIQYWAVADMTDGSESKVISFALDKSTIQAVANEQIVENMLGDYVSDLYILPSLK